MIRLHVEGVRIEVPSNQPLVLLKESLGERHVPIWIAPSDATAIAMAEQGVVPERPLTHDLLCNVIRVLGRRVTAVKLTKVEDGIFFAAVVLDDGTSVDSRASDAIAIAQRVDCQIWAAEELVAEAGVVIADLDDDDDDSADSDGSEEPNGSVGGQKSVEDERHIQEKQERQLRQFRKFLDDVAPEDFEN